MTTISVSAVPQPGPLGRAAGTSSGSIDRLPTDPQNLPPTEKLSPREIDVISTEAGQFAERVRNLIAEGEAKIENAQRVAFDNYDDLPRALREQRAKEDAQRARKRIVAELAPKIAESLDETRVRVERVSAQADFYRSAVATLQSYSWNSAALRLAPAMAGAGVGALLQAYRDSIATADVFLGAALLSRVAAISDDNYRVMVGNGFDKQALAMRLVGTDYVTARDSIRRARLALKDAEAAQYAFRQGKALPHADIDLGMQRAGHHNDEFRD